MQKIDAKIAAGFGFVVVGLLIVLHHFLICGRFFDVGDILHHEFFEAIFFTAGLVLLLIGVFDRKWMHS